MSSLIESFENLLRGEDKTENDIQRFLEENSQLIFTPFLLNHQLHFDVLISKFKIGHNRIADFAYLTKSSDCWNLVLVEIEDPKKSIYTNSKEQIHFHHEFNNAMDQVLDWKAYIEQNSEEIKKIINPLKTPLNNRAIRFKYVLIYGRSSEKENDLRKSSMFAQKTTEDILVMTYDSLISYFNNVKNPSGKLILTHWRDGYKVKIVPNELYTSIFAYLNPSDLKLEQAEKNALIQQEYEIEEWEKGHPLALDHKKPLQSLALHPVLGK